MTQLRDARLHKALEEAPDAQLQPHHRTREAIHAAAHAAVRPAWRQWWPAAPARTVPWSAALATLALATLVTVTWRGEEPPGAMPEAQAPVAAPAPASPPPPAPATAAPPAPAAAPSPAADAAPPPPAASKREARDALAKAARQESLGRSSARERQAPVAAPEPAPQPAPQRAPEPEAMREDARSAAPAPPPVAAAAPAAAPAPAPLPRAPALDRQAAPVAPGAPAAAFRAAPAPSLPWTQVRIAAEGRSVLVARAQAGGLAALVTNLLASASEETDASVAATLRLELAQGDAVLGVLELAGERWRWRPVREAGAARLLHADPATGEALRAEAQRLLQR